MSEKRALCRYLCADLVRVDWLEGEDGARTGEAVLEDISSLGACVQMEQAVPLGVTMTLTIGENVFNGYASHCTFQEYGYFVGIKFTDDSQWSSRIVEPAHLTNLKTIAEMGTDAITK